MRQLAFRVRMTAAILLCAATPALASFVEAPVGAQSGPSSMLGSTGGGSGPNGTFWNEVPFAVVPGASGNISLTMDIYAANIGTGPRPLLIWIHGGGWQSGSHNQVPSFALALRDRGITVASIEYRLTGEAIFPAQIHDCKGAVRFLRANAATYNIDPSRFGVWGSSAGGHLAALVTTSGGAANLEGTTGGNLSVSSAVQVGASFYGPTDILNMQLDCQAQAISCTTNHDAPTSPESILLGVSGAGEGLGWLRANIANPNPPFPAKVQLAMDSNPITYVNSQTPPMYVAHGDLDTTVPLNQSTRLRNALLAAGVEHVYTIVNGFGHGSLGNDASVVAANWLADHLVSCSCRADVDCSGGTTVQDVFGYLNLWFATSGRADVDGVGGVTIQDLFQYLNLWFQGC